MFGLFSPKQVLGVLASEIEKQKGYTIHKFVMIYTAKDHSILFQLNDDPEKLPLNEPSLADGIKMYVGENVPEDWELEYALVFYNVNGVCHLGIHMINHEGEKRSEKISI